MTDVWEWAVTKADYCQTCQDLGQDDDCASCEFHPPTLDRLNYTAYEVWARSQTQWRYSTIGGMGGSAPIPTGLDYAGVFAMAKSLDIDLAPGDVQKIQLLERYELKRIRELIDNAK
ncbi:DUF1799 domain-containing protein [uncultured Megasphaera sp.]|uniref:DUF1799 domain-containing protein n=1 Tax=uncultured Megasphaera sp. TaxID=165188 RepID=UPI002590B78E|nr:DUF1799 domain-containing protein [uncultured Megasphaera sp.]